MALRPRPLAAAAAAAALSLSLFTSPATAAPTPATHPAAPGVADCAPFTSRVATAEGGPVDQRIAGTLCTPRGTDATTVQLLVHGGTYDRDYWTVRGRTGGPTYVEAATRAGHATLNFDRLGSGASSAPHSSRYSDTHEWVTVQLIRELRERGFRKVVLVGHSVGATLSRMVAVKHPEAVDGLVLTGEGSPPNTAAFDEMSTHYIPAGQHPLLSGRGLDDGYLALRLGAKSDWFYHHRTTEPGVLLRDELGTEPSVYSTDPAYGDIALNKRIRVPVLVVVGQEDKLICGGRNGTDCSSPAALKAAAAPLYGPEARLETLLVPATGHSLNTHCTAATWYDQVQDWTERRVDHGPR